MILLATTSPDYLMPNTACQVQYKLGAPNCMAVDVTAACTGFVYALAIANQFIMTGVYKNILVLGAEIIHNFVDYSDRETCILFGDGAGAAILSRSHSEESSKIYSQHLHAEGSLSDLLYIEKGGSQTPFKKGDIIGEDNFIKMKGRDIFKNAVRTMSQCCKEALEFNKMSADEISWIVPHQANTRIIEAVAKHFGISMDKVIDVIEDMGNTSAATIPIALDTAIRDGRIQRDQNLLLTAFGAGLTSGSLLLKY
jgi:3-oxoacyl-[acyl-carrier-protein] synthase-3